jgi:hypothetical protein
MLVHTRERASTSSISGRKTQNAQTTNHAEAGLHFNREALLAALKLQIFYGTVNQAIGAS